MKPKKFVLALLLVFALGGPLFAGSAAAQTAGSSKMSLTVIPPFFQLPLDPGENWASTIKVVNPNPYDLVVYAQIMAFQADGEDGHGRFVPLPDSGAGNAPNTLTHWINVTSDPIELKKEGSAEIPFSVNIPANAPPGGHYASILIGTKPPKEKIDSPTIQISSYISTLLFVRVAGNVMEKGDIREFSADKSFMQSPDTAFSLRFENSGNVHLQPQGTVVIYNMWGKERGSIEINQNTEFGYVLPGTVRKFQFSWKGEKNPFEVGRYKAVATLAYGQDSRQNVYAVAYFWIVPLKPTLGILGGLAIFLFLTLRIIRVYIKKALQKEAARLGIAPADAAAGTRAQARANGTGNSAAYGRSQRTGRPLTFAGYVKEHALLIAVLVIFAAGVAGFAIYFTQVLKSERDYEVILQRNDGTMQVVPGGGSSATPAAQGNSRE